jgi:hypothetical protein
VQHRHIALAVAEDDCVLEVQELRGSARAGVAFSGAPAGGDERCVMSPRSSRRATSTRTGIVQEGVARRWISAAWWPRRTGSAAVKGTELHDPLDVGMKPMSSMRSASSMTRSSTPGEQQLAALEMVEQAAGRRDQDVDAAGDLHVLVAEGHAADERRHRQAVGDAVFSVEALLDLRGELARRARGSASAGMRARARPVSRSVSIAATKAAVLPVPVCAIPEHVPPWRARGGWALLLNVWGSYSRPSWTASWTFSLRPSSANDMRGGNHGSPDIWAGRE